MKALSKEEIRELVIRGDQKSGINSPPSLVVKNLLSDQELGHIVGALSHNMMASPCNSSRGPCHGANCCQ